MKVYSGVKSIPVPVDDWSNIDDTIQRQEQYELDIQAYAKTNGNGSYAGKLVQFPMGDGHAKYVVHSLDPLQLILLKVGDAWEYPYIDNLTANDIKDKIDTTEALTNLI